MTKILAAAAALVLVIVLVIGRDHERDAARAQPPPVAAQPVAPAPHGSHIRRITPEQRRELEQKIAAARAARAQPAQPQASHTGAAPAPPRLPASGAGGIENLPPGALDMLKEALPYLADCYEQGSQSPDQALAMLTLEGDPDVGTLIDPGAITDEQQQPIDPEIAGCLATTLQSLELPPLREGDSLKLQFTFRR